MEEKIIDARGHACPKPLIMTRKALKELSAGQQLRILIDNETSKINVLRFLSDNGIQASCTESAGVYTVLLSGTSAELAHPEAASYCTIPPRTDHHHVIVIKSDIMGTGSDELGAILMKAFINTIPEINPLPQTIVFYNSGILLAVEDSPVIESLGELEQRGVKILICGTCADYYHKKEKIGIGTISNMYSILETMTCAEKIICP